eukprot:Sspe_Gene.5751::Locus_1910_Transcript_1_1_Confidence_1.000_Length_3194::g.5751::m.5751
MTSVLHFAVQLVSGPGTTSPASRDCPLAQGSHRLFDTRWLASHLHAPPCVLEELATAFAGHFWHDPSRKTSLDPHVQYDMFTPGSSTSTAGLVELLGQFLHTGPASTKKSAGHEQYVLFELLGSPAGLYPPVSHGVHAKLFTRWSAIHEQKVLFPKKLSPAGLTLPEGHGVHALFFTLKFSLARTHGVVPGREVSCRVPTVLRTSRALSPLNVGVCCTRAAQLVRAPGRWARGTCPTGVIHVQRALRAAPAVVRRAFQGAHSSLPSGAPLPHGALAHPVPGFRFVGVLAHLAALGARLPEAAALIHPTVRRWFLRSVSPRRRGHAFAHPVIGVCLVRVLARLPRCGARCVHLALPCGLFACVAISLELKPCLARTREPPVRVGAHPICRVTGPVVCTLVDVDTLRCPVECVPPEQPRASPLV